MANYYRRLKKILKENDCYFVRQAEGSHEMWHSPISKNNFPISKSINKKGTFNGVLKQAGINKKI